MELDRLNHFVATALELHFGRAAERLGMDPAQLSRSIARLEDSIGTKLLDRNRRQVLLTPAGVAFLKEAQGILKSAKHAARLARRVATNEVGELRISFASVATYGTLQLAIKRFRDFFPDIAVRLFETPPQERVLRLEDGELDLLVLLRLRGDRTGLEKFAVRSIKTLRIVLAVPDPWPVAKQKSVRLRDLKDLPHIMFDQEPAPRLHELVMSAYRRAGVDPKIVQHAWQPVVTLGFVAAEVGVSITVHTADYLGIKGVTLLPIEDLPPGLEWELLAVWEPTQPGRAPGVFAELLSGIE